MTAIILTDSYTNGMSVFMVNSASVRLIDNNSLPKSAINPKNTPMIKGFLITLMNSDFLLIFSPFVINIVSDNTASMFKNGMVNADNIDAIAVDSTPPSAVASGKPDDREIRSKDAL